MACVACKSQKTKCIADCIFAASFGGDNAPKFASINHFWARDRLGKMLSAVHEDQRADFVDSLFEEARYRLDDGVHGSIGVINALKARVANLEAQNAALKEENDRLEALSSLGNLPRQQQLSSTVTYTTVVSTTQMVHTASSLGLDLAISGPGIQRVSIALPTDPIDYLSPTNDQDHDHGFAKPPAILSTTSHFHSGGSVSSAPPIDQSFQSPRRTIDFLCQINNRTTTGQDSQAYHSTSFPLQRSIRPRRMSLEPTTASVGFVRPINNSTY
ncbi:unnamed protein product [Microthlaspi erraticum]|uniref:LOB domain-containing protein n=1 Tax=Microthlaspi erraticum TaxID=1685480 RepID=A0A6D2HU33_9BRAS|nr:unnamed protein product [Microthlaspi erraticum]